MTRVGRGQSRKQQRAKVLARKLPKGTHCENCGSDGRLHAHHDDYDKPLSVRWLCPGCHGEWHATNGPGANRPDVGTEEGIHGITFPRSGSLLGWTHQWEADNGS